MREHGVDLMELIGAVYEGPRETDPWLGLAQRLRQLLCARSVAVTLHHSQGLLFDVMVMAQEPGDDADWHALENIYRKDFMAADPFRYENMAPGEILFIRAASAAPAMQVFLEQFDIAHCLRLCFSEPGGMLCWIDVIRRRQEPDQPFTETDAQLLRELLPHLQRALGLYALLKRQEAEKSIYENIIDHFALGCVLLNDAGGVIQVNSAARAIIDRAGAIAISHGRIRLADRAAQRVLDTSIETLAQARRSNGASTAGKLVRVRARDGTLLALLVYSAPLMPYFQGVPAPSVIVYLSDLARKPDALLPASASAHVQIARLFDLSPQEARLALLLAYGYTISEAAAEMHIAETAARNYSKRVYAKVGIGSQTDLVRLVYRNLAFLR